MSGFESDEVKRYIEKQNAKAYSKHYENLLKDAAVLPDGINSLIDTYFVGKVRILPVKVIQSDSEVKFDCPETLEIPKEFLDKLDNLRRGAVSGILIRNRYSNYFDVNFVISETNHISFEVSLDLKNFKESFETKLIWSYVDKGHVIA